MRGLAPAILALALTTVSCSHDSPSTPTGPSQPTVPPEVGVWLRQNSLEFRTAEPGGSDEDLDMLPGLVGSAHLVALGEATHGTHEFFAMKQRILRYLVQHMGFTAFALEASFPEAEAVDEYVRTGKGDPYALLSRLYQWSWNTQEMLELVEWMRQYNKAVPAEKQVRFFGFDIAYPSAALDSARAYLARIDAAARADTLLTCYAPYVNNYLGQFPARYVYLPAETKAACRARVRAAYAWLAEHRSQYSAASSLFAFEHALQYTRLVVQAEEWNSGTIVSAAELPPHWAENVGWLLDHLPTGSRMVLWTHNLDVQRCCGALGELLSRRYGGDLVVFGFDFGAGRFNAGRFVGGWSYGAGVHQSDRPLPGSYESYFEVAGRPRMIVPLRGPAPPEWLVGPRPQRAIGNSYAAAQWDQFYRTVSLPAVYDALVYFQSARQTTLLPFAFQ